MNLDDPDAGDAYYEEVFEHGLRILRVGTMTARTPTDPLPSDRYFAALQNRLKAQVPTPIQSAKRHARREAKYERTVKGRRELAARLQRNIARIKNSHAEWLHEVQLDYLTATPLLLVEEELYDSGIEIVRSA